MDKIKCFFGFHNWFWFNFKSANQSINDGLGKEFIIRPKMCLKCNKIGWDHVTNNLRE